MFFCLFFVLERKIFGRTVSVSSDVSEDLAQMAPNLFRLDMKGFVYLFFCCFCFLFCFIYLFFFNFFLFCFAACFGQNKNFGFF